MKNILLISGIFIMALFSSCDQRIELDMEQWGDHAYIDNAQLFKLDIQDDFKLEEYYRNGTLVTGVRQLVISDGTAVTDSASFTATIKLKEGEDISRIGIKFWHKATLIEPLNGAPKAGTVNDFSARSFKYRLYSADGTEHDWTIIIVD